MREEDLPEPDMARHSENFRRLHAYQRRPPGYDRDYLMGFDL